MTTCSGHSLKSTLSSWEQGRGKFFEAREETAEAGEKSRQKAAHPQGEIPSGGGEEEIDGVA
jgi:hypothetical protein